jgi:hypothetical protein
MREHVVHGVEPPVRTQPPPPPPPGPQHPTRSGVTDTELRRVILHAADLLDAVSDMKELTHLAYGNRAVVAELRSLAMAIGTAKTTLRLVAACMVTETEARPTAMPIRGPSGRFVKVSAYP